MVLPAELTPMVLPFRSLSDLTSGLTKIMKITFSAPIITSLIGMPRIAADTAG
jgi:hypothetical protein